MEYDAARRSTRRLVSVSRTCTVLVYCHGATESVMAPATPHTADVGLLLCRTDSAAPRRAGISAFLVDMHSPGVEVRPLRQMTGGSSFNEVFLDDWRVPDGRLVGALGEGWQVAMETLRIERAAIGFGLGRGGLGIADGSRLIELLRTRGLTADTALRQQLAEV